MTDLKKWYILYYSNVEECTKYITNHNFISILSNNFSIPQVCHYFINISYTLVAVVKDIEFLKHIFIYSVEILFCIQLQPLYLSLFMPSQNTRYEISQTNYHNPIDNFIPHLNRSHYQQRYMNNKIIYFTNLHSNKSFVSIL